MPISTDLRNRCVTRSVNLSNIEPENERKNDQLIANPFFRINQIARMPMVGIQTQ